MTDSELLEFAAKANGRPWKWVESKYGYKVPGMLVRDGAHEVDYYFAWNPLEDDGDAFRLAVKVLPFYVLKYTAEDYEYCHGDGLAATRRAIVRAAAEIGKEI